jgi:pSer/pThr/pTyr-binding forkhead associated (FHA) protein
MSAHAVIDLSNVCRADNIPPLGVNWGVLDRIDLVEAAWRAEYGADAGTTLVADDSLKWVLRDPADQDRYRRLIRQGRVATAPNADPVFLEIARRRQCHVLSRDRFIDLRTDFPFIEVHPERFLSWRMADGRLRLRRSGIVPVTRRKVSSAQEDKEAKRNTGFDPREHEKVLHTRWICPGDCVHAQTWPDGLRVWPVKRSGVPTCPECGSRLHAAGRRRPLREIQVLRALDEKEIMRFPLEADAALVLGRGALSDGVNLAMSAAGFRAALEQVSRQHVLIDLETGPDGTGTRFVAVDLGSTNGTALKRWRGIEHGFSGPVPLDPGAHQYFGEGDQLLLGGTILIAVSGRRFVVDPQLPADDGRGGGVTTTLSDGDPAAGAAS